MAIRKNTQFDVYTEGDSEQRELKRQAARDKVAENEVNTRSGINSPAELARQQMFPDSTVKAGAYNGTGVSQPATTPPATPPAPGAPPHYTLDDNGNTTTMTPAQAAALPATQSTGRATADALTPPAPPVSQGSSYQMNPYADRTDPVGIRAAETYNDMLNHTNGYETHPGSQAGTGYANDAINSGGQNANTRGVTRIDNNDAGGWVQPGTAGITATRGGGANLMTPYGTGSIDHYTGPAIPPAAAQPSVAAQVGVPLPPITPESTTPPPSMAVGVNIPPIGGMGPFLQDIQKSANPAIPKPKNPRQFDPHDISGSIADGTATGAAFP